MIDTMRKLIACCLLVAALPALAALTQIRTFDLHHRSAGELIPLLRPLVDSEGAISGSGQVLIVRSTLQNLSELESAIQNLDTARRQLMISVRQNVDERTMRRGGSVSAKIGEDAASASVRIHSSKDRGDERIAQRLRVSEGGWAVIHAGEAVPLPRQSVTTGRGGTFIERSIEYRDVESGFEARPRLIGNGRVVVDIRPFRQRRSSRGGVIEQQEIVTTVEGNLGEWLEIGGGVNTARGDDQGLTDSTRQKEKTTRQVLLRVDPIGQQRGESK